MPTAVVGAKVAARDPWATFCASGEILSAAAAKDVAGVTPLVLLLLKLEHNIMSSGICICLTHLECIY